MGFTILVAFLGDRIEVEFLPTKWNDSPIKAPMAEATTSSEKARRFICPGCGANLIYEPVDGLLLCPYCGRRESIAASEEQIEEHSYEDYLHLSSDRLSPIAANALEVTCSSCGATVTFTPPEVAGACPFCGTAIVAQPKAADPLVSPEAVLPFQINQKQADEAIKGWLASRWFAPNGLKKLAYREGVSGVYLPHWTYDVHALSFYRGERGEHYYVTEEYIETDAQGNQITKRRQVQHTNWYPVSGNVQRWFDDVIVRATISINTKHLEALGNWDLSQLKPYNPAYLAGFKAQRYEVALSEGFEIAKKTMATMIDVDVRREIGGDEQRVHTIHTQYSGISFKHILLPIYLGAYRFNQKVYQVMVNANSGFVHGDRPFSFWKIFLFVLFLITLVALLILFIQSSR